ncbi:reverse transcriptase [Phytophthora megakarya]|uniref:Reverse transcriptase n=1 Tax=Phytophthora megakarya TaxID=4795 RepID=A0A225UYU4_9STRA|nr:reverse transcriptase [Phytophthora megakarya]
MLCCSDSDIGISRLSELGKQAIPYLSHEVCTEGIRATPKIAKSDQDLPFPSTLKGVQSFLGSLNYYNKFIEDLPVIKKIAKGSDRYVLDSRDVLYRLAAPTPERPRDKRSELRLVVPEALRPDILHHALEDFQSGHQGITRTYERLRSEFSGPGCSKTLTCLSQNVRIVRPLRGDHRIEYPHPGILNRSVHSK